MSFKATIPIRVNAELGATANSAEFYEFGSFDKAVFYLDATAVSGTSPTLDTIIQEYDELGDAWYTLVSFTQVTGVTTERKVVNPLFGTRLRATFTIGGSDTPTVTFSLNAVAMSDEPQFG